MKYKIDKKAGTFTVTCAAVVASAFVQYTCQPCELNTNCDENENLRMICPNSVEEPLRRDPGTGWVTLDQSTATASGTVATFTTL